ncbi:MAG: nitrous oxide reductase accessory protein NosL [Arcobacter sp.]|uniref:nitrous oxide reductase accessory protein NosL n=1 Tax=Arcobacter sp. TaxID=1872629 RepID=UPI003B003960
MFKKSIFGLLLISTLGICSQITYLKEDVGVIRKINLSKNPVWVAQITTNKGKKVLFCSPKSMFEFYYRPHLFKEYEATSSDDLDEILVTDYKSLKAINGRNAYYVYGSSKTSPSGDDLVAFEKKIDAKNFASNYNGKRIFRFSKVSFALIELLNGDI